MLEEEVAEESNDSAGGGTENLFSLQSLEEGLMRSEMIGCKILREWMP